MNLIQRSQRKPSRRSGRRTLAALVLGTSLLAACASQKATTAGASPSTAGSGEPMAAEVPAPAASAMPHTEAAVAGDPASPIGRDWIFAKADGYDGPLPGPPPLAGFIMTKEAKRLTGSTGCNRMSAGYQIDVKAGLLRFININNTRMMCDRAGSGTEQAVLNALIATQGFRIVDGKLQLISKGNVIATLVIP